MKNFLFIFLTLLIIGGICIAFMVKNTIPEGETRTAALDKQLQQRYGLSRLPQPGAQVLVARGDSVLFEGYYGMATQQPLTAIDQDTRLNIASCSKQFTVVALMKCLADHGGDINDKVTKYLPQYTHPIWENITLADLAGHTSGIADSRDRSDRHATIVADDETSVAYFANVDRVQFAPGAAYDYLNPSFILLAKVIERLSGQPFVDYVQANIFDPLGMTHTYYFDPQAELPYQAHGYEPGDDGKWHEYDYGEETFFATRPDGGIYSTVGDLLKWERALATGQVIPVESVRQAYTKRVDVSSSPYCDYQRRPNTWYGLGWFVEDTPDGTMVYHTGDNGGFQAFIGKFPYDANGNWDSEPLTVIVLENRHDLSRRDLYQGLFAWAREL